MVLLCFVLDLPSLSPPLLRDLKQSLLQVANLYAISASQNELCPSRPLEDRIGLCYLLFDRISCSTELKIAYSPRESFSLRDFHQAVHNLPNDAFLPLLNDTGTLYCRDFKLSSVFCGGVLYTWGGKDVMRKVIFLSSCVVESVDSVLREALMDAADKCITVEFVLLEPKSSHLSNVLDIVNNFTKDICDLENCSFQKCVPDVHVLSGLVKHWLLELTGGIEEPLQARFKFKNNLLGSVNLISCKLSRCFYHISDGFSPCMMCSCHGMLLDKIAGDENKKSSCPVTGHDLKTSDLIENSIKVGEQTILFLPSFQSCMKLQKISSSIDFSVLERINLGSLSEGVIVGASHFVTPSTYHETDASLIEIDKFELNAQLFKGLCSSLHSMDQGLVCSSNCNIETMMNTLLHCYYILQPSDEGIMLIRRLAGAEEFLPVPHLNRIDCSLSRETEESIQSSLLMMESRDYSPLLHERGFHRTLNLLVKESLNVGSVLPKLKKGTIGSTQAESPEVPLKSKVAINLTREDEIAKMAASNSTQTNYPAVPLKSAIDLTREDENAKMEGTVVSNSTHTDYPEASVGSEASIDLTKEESAEMEGTFVSNSTQTDYPTVYVKLKASIDLIKDEEDIAKLDSTDKEWQGTTTAHITEEWEQLVVNEMPVINSLDCISKPKSEQSPDSSRQLDLKTSRILERLEVPRQLKSKLASPVISSLPTKRPLIPFQPRPSIGEDSAISPKMKPNFQRLKRKQR